jgi:hypothetical protein
MGLEARVSLEGQAPIPSGRPIQHNDIPRWCCLSATGPGTIGTEQQGQALRTETQQGHALLK